MHGGVPGTRRLIVSFLVHPKAPTRWLLREMAAFGDLDAAPESTAGAASTSSWRNPLISRAALARAAAARRAWAAAAARAAAVRRARAECERRAVEARDAEDSASCEEKHPAEAALAEDSPAAEVEPEWYEGYDETRDAFYYFNTATEESIWAKPDAPFVPYEEGEDEDEDDGDGSGSGEKAGEKSAAAEKAAEKSDKSDTRAAEI